MKLVSVFFILIVLGGCCKVYCDGKELTVSFEKFKASDTDTVLFISYLPGNRQTTIVDSFRILSQTSPADTTRSSVAHSISSNYDWRVLLPSINRQFVFENFELSNEKCKCGGANYQSISSFLVNGIRTEGLIIRVK